jgi:hypothetical protein
MNSPPFVTIEQQLAALPATGNGEFFAASRSAAERLKDHQQDLLALSADRSMPVEARLKALYLALHTIRRRGNLIDYRRIVDECRRVLGHYPIFRTFEVVYERSLGDDERSMARAVRASRRSLECYGDSPGVLHQFAELVVTEHELHRSAKRDALHEAERAVERAISLSPEHAPRYWNTLARVQSLLGDFLSARRSITEALELEAKATPDAEARLSEHQLVQTRIHLAEDRQRAETRDKEARSELYAIRTQTLEILGLLAAIIAFLTTSVSITSGQSFQDAVRLLVVSASLIVIVFSVFAYAFRVSSLVRLLLPLAAGVGIFLASLLLR